MVLAVRVSSTHADGIKREQLAHTLDITAGGARIAGLESAIEVGQVVTVQRGTVKRRFKVVWASRVGNRQYQAGLEAMEPLKDMWRLELPDAADDYDGRSAPKGRSSQPD